MSIILYLCGIIIMSYLFFLGQIIIHNCVHGSAFRTRARNRIVGQVIASLQLANYEGWRVAHLLHHRYTNDKRDPYRIEMPAVPYIVSQYFRHVREFWDGRKYIAAIAPPIGFACLVILWHAQIGQCSRGLLWVGCFWLLPTMVSHMLVAHFNYITHVGLPQGRGEDTRSFDWGVWRVINKLTLNFYLHREHHLSPSEAIPTPNPLVTAR
jgi:fatty acid desaturase